MENKTNLEYQLEQRRKQGYDVPDALCVLAYCADTGNYSCLNRKCSKCKFNNNVKMIVKTLLKEHKEKIIVTEDEKAILKNIPNPYRYIARDKSGTIYVFSHKPKKCKNIWDNERGKLNELRLFSHLFSFIKWEDEEPREISNLLEELGGN